MNGGNQRRVLPTLRGLYTPAFFSTSAQMGTVELTGLLRGGKRGRQGGQAGPGEEHAQQCWPKTGHV